MTKILAIVASALAIAKGLMQWLAGKAKQNEQKKHEIHEGVHSDNDSDFLDQF